MDFVLKQRAKRAQDGNQSGGDREEDDEDLGLIELGVKGLWRECILYEVPLMAIRKFGSIRRFYLTIWLIPST